MKYKLTENHQVRLSDTIIKAGVYTLEQLKEFHKDQNFEWCVKYTKLAKKLIPFVEEIKTKIKK
jgi:hypothetical protein